MTESPQQFLERSRAERNGHLQVDEIIRPNYTTAGQLIQNHPELREPIVDGLFRRGEIMNIIAAAKVGKSWLVLMLLLCIATGRMFLGRYATRQARVLLIDNELHRPTIAKRIKAVADAMGILPSEYADMLCIESMRGRHATIDKLGEYFKAITPGEFGVIVIDAWYRAIPKGTDENSNADITQLYNVLDGYAAITGAAFVLIHHSSKGSQADKSIVDVGAGASAQARAADAHLIIRPHEEDGAVVVEGVARSFPQPKPIGLRWAYPMWTVDDSLDVTLLKRPSTRRADKQIAEPEIPKPEPWTPERFASSFITSQPQSMADILAAANVAGVGMRKAETLLRTVRSKGLAFQWSKPKSNAVLLCNREQSITDLGGNDE